MLKESNCYHCILDCCAKETQGDKKESTNEKGNMLNSMETDVSVCHNHDKELSMHLTL